MQVGFVEVGKYMTFANKRVRIVEYKAYGNKCELCICKHCKAFKDFCYKNHDIWPVFCEKKHRTDRKSVYIKFISDIKSKKNVNQEKNISNPS